MVIHNVVKEKKIPWNKGKLIGQKLPLKASQVWSIRTLLIKSGNKRDLALLNLAIDSKLRSCDLVALKRADVAHSNRVLCQSTIMQQKTHSPVTFEITKKTRLALDAWFEEAGIRHDEYIFKSRLHDSQHITTRTYARIVRPWVESIGLERLTYSYPWQSLVDRELKIIAGSDVPVELGDPRIEFYAAITRSRLDGTSNNGWHPELAVTREDALRMLTLWPAHWAFQENERGTVEVGKLADLSIFDTNFMTAPPKQILKAQTVMTVVNGKIAYPFEL